MQWYNIYKDEETGEDCCDLVCAVGIFTTFNYIKMKYIEIYL